MLQPRTIRLCYRKIIDAQSTHGWDKLVYTDTYTEFKLQSQSVSTPEQLQFLVSAAAIGYLQQLNSIVPDLQNSLGKLFLPFQYYRFEIISQTPFRMAISFITEPLTWHDTIGNQLLLSATGETENGEQLTHMVTLPPFVSIYSIC